MTFEDQINILVYFHLEEHHSGWHLLRVLKKSHFARRYITPEKGIKKSCFFEDISSRGLEQIVELFGKLYMEATKQLTEFLGNPGMKKNLKQILENSKVTSL